MSADQTSSHPQAASWPDNALAGETSPYLLQHKNNPVHWMPWTEAAFARALDEDKPILLSIGYAACHWCHVMAHESFEDPDTATIINSLFVAIKVDREERPDLDHIYQTALALLGQQGGWPLTMFLTAAGDPFWGGTYFPPTSRWGRPAFADVLRSVAEACRLSPDKVTNNVAALGRSLTRLADSQPGVEITAVNLDMIADRLLREVDPVDGGLGSAPKFPQPFLFELLWRAWKRTGRADYRDAVLTTLRHLAQGGIYDHLGGGFARYSTDPIWLVPHFEKMLYDNAQLIALMTLVWLDTGDALLARRVRETIAWTLREMLAEGGDGAFAATLDADSEGVEGRFYVWSEAEIDQILGADATRFKPVYGVSAAGNWEGTNILNRLGSLALDDPATEAERDGWRARLLDARQQRVRPGWDDKVLADWNGLMIAALAQAGFAFGDPAWTAAAERAFAFVCDRMGKNGRLGHSWRHGILKHAGMLDDYANMARAAVILGETTGNPRYLDQARVWVDTLDQHFWDRKAGGYFFTADDAERLIVRSRNAHDSAVPSGNGTMAELLLRLYFLTGEDRFRDRAEALLLTFAGEIERNFFPLCTLLNAADLRLRAQQAVLVGDAQTPGYDALLAALRRCADPNRVVMLLPPDQTLPPSHAAAGKTLIDGRAALYLCHGMTCSAPITDPRLLERLWRETGPSLNEHPG
ncbi:MAG: thioredoxin domain-containing protein [Azospirillaceae bacterium]|nr:thioredoxin domain-containing protein [Azospirillaceae bacterium]